MWGVWAGVGGGGVGECGVSGVRGCQGLSEQNYCQPCLELQSLTFKTRL